MRKRIEDLAKEEERPVGAMVRSIIRDGLAVREKKAAKKKAK